jgi:hypothetical protein
VRELCNRVSSRKNEKSTPSRQERQRRKSIGFALAYLRLGVENFLSESDRLPVNDSFTRSCTKMKIFDRPVDDFVSLV